MEGLVEDRDLNGGGGRNMKLSGEDEELRKETKKRAPGREESGLMAGNWR